MPHDLTLHDASFDRSSGAAVMDGGYGVVEWTAFPPEDAVFTIEAWVMTTELGALKVALGQISAGWIGVLAGGEAGGHVGHADTMLQSGVFIADGAWHHLAIVSNGLDKDGALYVDGVRVGTQARILADANTSQFAVGEFGGAVGVGFRWIGRLAEVAVWTVARHGADFTPSRQALLGTEPGLWALYHLDGNGRDTALPAEVEDAAIGQIVPAIGMDAPALEAPASAIPGPTGFWRRWKRW